MADPTQPAAPAAETMTLVQWALEQRLAVAELNHMQQVNAIDSSTVRTAEEFAALLDATRKARV